MLYIGSVRVDERMVAGEAVLRVELSSPVHEAVPMELPVTVTRRERTARRTPKSPR